MFDLKNWIAELKSDQGEFISPKAVRAINQYVVLHHAQPCCAYLSRVWKGGKDLPVTIILVMRDRLALFNIGVSSAPPNPYFEIRADCIRSLQRLDPSDAEDNFLMKTLSINGGEWEFSDGPPYDDGSSIFAAVSRLL